MALLVKVTKVVCVLCSAEWYVENRGVATAVSAVSIIRGPQANGAPTCVTTVSLIDLIDLILTSHCSATRGLLATDHVILNHGQVTWTTPELAPPLLTTTPHQREDVSALDRFNVHRCPTRRVFSGTGIELVTRQATIRYLYHSATAATQSH
ncbi:uncharacterized protein TNCV_2229951 [Trichonephila clavipes]|uniref:Secreted protein n=1 Tax=Trichonephila clavipes TaxID=2585209 RepID=A0A8X6WER7_TRICX|nr:uncharacterized protein TNCV_2229951 [Trichonephila clavipes]